MATIEVTFWCGHGAAVDVDKTPSPACAVCGESRVARVQAPAPRITGCASGPHVVTQALDPIPVKVGTGAMP